MKILDDQIGKTQFTLLYNGIDVLGFRETGISLIDTRLEKDGKLWEITGNAIGDHESLQQINVTGNVYWYMWSKFYPDTELYV